MANVFATVWGTELIRILAALAILHQDEERDELILFFLSSWCNSSYSSYCPGAIHPILHIILVQFILFFKSSWCNSSYSSCCPGAINPILQFVLVQNSKELNQFCPQAAATTFAFSSVFIILLCPPPPLHSLRCSCPCE